MDSAQAVVALAGHYLISKACKRFIPRHMLMHRHTTASTSSCPIIATHRARFAHLLQRHPGILMCIPDYN